MATIHAKTFEAELQTYTMALLKKIQDKYNIPIGELAGILEDGKCNHTYRGKHTGKICKCTQTAVKGTMYCRKHNTALDNTTELEYIEINTKPYLYDPLSRRVYSYGTKTPDIIGVLDEDLNNIVV